MIRSWNLVLLIALCFFTNQGITKEVINSLTDDDIREVLMNKGDMSAWFCLYSTKDVDSKVIKNFAYEIDKDSLYIKLNNKIIPLMRIKSNGDSRHYNNSMENIQVILTVLRESKCSEYNESCDIDAMFNFKQDEYSNDVFATGQDCGI